MAVRDRKTREFKDRQCRYCPLRDKAKFRQGRPCCPLPHPRIENGHCRDKEEADIKSGKKVRKFGTPKKKKDEV